MSSAVAYLMCAQAVLATVVRLALTRGLRRPPGERRLMAFLLGLGAGVAVLAPGTRAAVPWDGAARLLPLLGVELKLGAECALALLGYGLRPRGDGRGGTAGRRQAVGSALVMALAAAAYLGGGVRPEGTELVAGAGGRAQLVLYDALFTAHGCWCVGVFGLVILRSSGRVAPGLPRTGLRLIAAGAAFGLAWSALSAVPLLEAVATGRQEIAENTVAAPAAVLCLALGIGGTTLAVWTEALTRSARRARAWRDHRRLGPLWTALRTAVPGLSLAEAVGGLGPGGPLRDPEFALYRRVIEIRDGQLALRAHHRPQAVEWAAAASAGDAAVVEAAALAVALESVALESVASGSAALESVAEAASAGPGPRELPADLAAETAWLVRVSTAFAHSPVVAQARRRVREGQPARPDRP
ncbi:MAB_1171c family putative transporter [Kitasatospora sp. NPDC058162]|uniref:MAB_1171c family putative transporter n=1 Tax=Kitasatospora sp. NPDC058162 TaxID=3346362 RepID=UPI0036D858BB